MDNSQRCVRRKHLLFRSWHRGMREMDMLLGRFAELHIDSFSESQLTAFEAILNHVDPDIYAWLSGREPVPAEMQSDVMSSLKKFTVSIDKY